jgi:hypothetical protein
MTPPAALQARGRRGRGQLIPKEGSLCLLYLLRRLVRLP